MIEPHQVVATLSCLTSVARPLVAGGEEFPAGQLHVLTLLRLALPGIDPNDFRKSMVNSLRCKLVPYQKKSKGVSFICHFFDLTDLFHQDALQVQFLDWTLLSSVSSKGLHVKSMQVERDL